MEVESEHRLGVAEALAGPGMNSAFLTTAATLKESPDVETSCTPSIQGRSTIALVVTEAAACGPPLVLRDLEDFRELFAAACLGAESPPGFSNRIR